MIAGLGAAAAFAAGVGVAGWLVIGGALDPDDSAIVPTPDETAFSLQVWNVPQRLWQADDLDVSGLAGEAATFLLIVDGSTARSRHVIVSFQCRGLRQAQLVTPGDPARAITAPGPGRIRADSTALAGVLSAWSATFPEPPTWSPADTCSELQILEFAMRAHGTPAYFIWEASVSPGAAREEGGAMSVAVRIDGSPAQSLNVNLRP